MYQVIDHQSKDGSGAISSSELLGVMRSMGKNPTEDEVLNLMMEADVDGDGTIDFPEFVNMMTMMRNQATSEDTSSDFT